MQDFSDFIGLVNDMMDEFGTVGTLVVNLEGDGYDPATGTTNSVTADIPIKCIIMDLTLQSNGAGTRDKTLIQDGDKVLYVRPSDELLPILMPDGILAVDSSDDKVVVGGHTYDVVTTKVLDPTASGTKPIMFELYIRR
jgi:hypothetical protein